MSEIKYEIIKKIGVLSTLASDILHHGKVVVFLRETIRSLRVGEVPHGDDMDGVIESAGGWVMR